MTPTAKIHRALIAIDAAGVPRVLATDSAHIAFDIKEVVCGSDAEEIGILDAKDIGPGLWLWEGAATPVNMALWDERPEWEPQYDGSVREVVLADEVATLFAMRPPEPIDDDRDTPEAHP